MRRCLEKSPDERFQSSRDIGFALSDAASLVTGEEKAGAAGSDSRAVVAPPRSRRALLWAGLGAGVLAAGLVAVLLVARNRKPEASGVPKVDSIAVLPLENLSRDPEQEYFADGMTEALITNLARIGALRVISRTSVMHYKGARKPLPQIARELDVDAVVEGSVLRAGDRVRITAQLIHAPTDRHLWAEDYERPLRDVLSLQSEVARAIAREIEIRLTPQQVQRLAARPVDPEAYEAYLKGRYFWNKRSSEGLKQAIAFFERATSKDPTYAPAHAGLADCYTILGSRRLLPPAEAFSKARKAAEESVQLDESLAEGHTSLGAALWNELDYAGAEREFRRAIELNPSYATARQWYGEWLNERGRHREALAELRRAVESDPLSLIVRSSLAGTHYFAGDYDVAAEQLRKVLEMDPAFLAAYYYLGRTLLAQGKPREAIAEFLKFEENGSIPSPVLAAMGYAYAAAGESAKARELFEDLRERSRRGYVSPLDFAILHAGLREKDQAFARLREACAERAGNVGEVGVDPLFDSLRSDPHFAEILRCLGLKNEASSRGGAG
jgi:TolB-like protein/Tfp pilus assembly protein PilF